MVQIKRKSYKRSFFASKDSPFVDYVEGANHLEFKKSHTDVSYYQSTAETVESFMASGKILADNKKLKYDFEDGKDDGSDVPLTRSLSDPSDIFQALHDEENRLENVGKERKKKKDAKDEHNELIDAIQKSAQSLPDNVDSSDVE